MLVTTEMLYNEIQDIKKLLKQLVNSELEHSIEELSLNKACKLLKRGSFAVIQLVKAGKLDAIKYKDRKNKTRYRFRVADIRKYQRAAADITSPEYEHDNVESAEDIAKRIFKK